MADGKKSAPHNMVTSIVENKLVITIDLGAPGRPSKRSPEKTILVASSAGFRSIAGPNNTLYELSLNVVRERKPTDT